MSTITETGGVSEKLLVEQPKLGTTRPGLPEPAPRRLRRAEKRQMLRSVRNLTNSLGRSHHFIDIENLFGRHHESPFQPWFADLYSSIAGLRHNDLVSIAADINHAHDLASVFPGARRLVGVGPDGADIALIDSIDWPSLVRGCDTVVIASGDQRFTDLAYRARSFGLRVIVVALADSLSKRLAPYADEVIFFPPFDPELPPHLTRAA